MSYARDGTQMVLERMARLISQAEREGVTLAEVIAREMSIEEMELTQDALAVHIDGNYENIRGFMSGVSVPSLDDIIAGLHTDDEYPFALAGWLSDDEAAGD